MSIIETVKKAGQVVIEVVKANPVAAGGVAVGTAAIVGGGVWWNKRRKAKKAEAVAPAAKSIIEDAVAQIPKPDLKVVDGQPAKTA